MPCTTSHGSTRTPLALAESRVAHGLDGLRTAPGRAWQLAAGALRRLRGRERHALADPVELEPRHRVAIVLHYAKLDPEDRFRRFHGKVSFMGLMRRYAGIDWERTAFLGQMAKGQVVGLVELYEPEDAAAAAECAVSVLRGWQGRGVGEALLRAAVERVCRGQGRDLLLSTQTDNLRLIRLARRLGARSAGSEAGVAELVFRAEDAAAER